MNIKIFTMKANDDKIKQFKLNRFTLSPVAIIAISFFLVIFIGSIFLILPISHNPGAKVKYLDALFTSTSCTCVTGLVSVRTGIADSFSIFGRVVMAILIQLGGLGVTTLAVIFFMIASRKLTFSEQSLIKESWNLNNLRGIKKIFFLVLLVSFSFEIFGACLSFLDFYFIHKYDMATSWGYAFFHSISSFNNAGFDIIGNSSLIEFENDIYLNDVSDEYWYLGTGLNEWITGGNTFCGHFDGNGNVVHGIYYKDTAAEMAALFPKLGPYDSVTSVTVKNVGIRR